MHDPNTTPQGSVDYFSLMLALLFGLWGDVARYLNEVLQEKRKFHFFELWVSAVVSGFCGVLIGLLALHFAMEAYLVMFGAGLAGGKGGTGRLPQAFGSRGGQFLAGAFADELALELREAGHQM